MSPLRRLAALVVVLLALTAGAPPAYAAEDGSIGIQLLEAPESRRDDPRARTYIVDHVSPGTVVDRAFEVSNTTAERQRLRIYPGPAEIRDGAFVVADAGARSELTSWTTVSQRRVRLAPDGRRRLRVRIEVPDDASEGERYGVVWASASSRGDGQVRMVNRVGIRIYLSVGPGGEPASDFAITSLTPERARDGSPMVRAEVTNTGGRALDLQGALRLSDGPGGLSAGPFEVKTETLAPGDREAIPIPLDKALPDGPWQARLVLRSGLLTKRAAATITFPDAGTGESVPVKDPDDAGWILWSLAVVLGLAVLLAALLAWWLRRRRRDVTSSSGNVPASGATRS